MSEALHATKGTRRPDSPAQSDLDAWTNIWPEQIGPQGWTLYHSCQATKKSWARGPSLVQKWSRNSETWWLEAWHKDIQKCHILSHSPKSQCQRCKRAGGTIHQLLTDPNSDFKPELLLGSAWFHHVLPCLSSGLWKAFESTFSYFSLTSNL